MQVFLICFHWNFLDVIWKVWKFPNLKEIRDDCSLDMTMSHDKISHTPPVQNIAENSHPGDLALWRLVLINISSEKGINILYRRNCFTHSRLFCHNIIRQISVRNIWNQCSFIYPLSNSHDICILLIGSMFASPGEQNEPWRAEIKSMLASFIYSISNVVEFTVQVSSPSFKFPSIIYSISNVVEFINQSIKTRLEILNHSAAFYYHYFLEISEIIDQYFARVESSLRLHMLSTRSSFRYLIGSLAPHGQTAFLYVIHSHSHYLLRYAVLNNDILSMLSKVTISVLMGWITTFLLNITFCGRPGISTAQKWTRIVGGTDTIAGKWPWQVIIIYIYLSHKRGDIHAKEVYCGAVLISPQWLMTAAHLKFINGEKKYEQRRKVTKLLIHPRYNKKTMDFDIALLKLKRPFKLNNKIKPVCLPSHNFTVPSGQMMTILGWGKRYFLQENATNTLQEAQIPLVSRSECKTAYKNDDVMISKNMVCGGFSDGKADSCSGDSGGPLLYKNPLTKQWFAYGITSFGAGCGLPNRYGIYALVPNVVKWIKNSIVFN
ncbi:Enteropeptidase [Nymphon striatum]|nr:Enteropeptidase [Nymphon striatum]